MTEQAPFLSYHYHHQIHSHEYYKQEYLIFVCGASKEVGYAFSFIGNSRFSFRSRYSMTREEFDHLNDEYEFENNVGTFFPPILEEEQETVVRENCSDRGWDDPPDKIIVSTPDYNTVLNMIEHKSFSLPNEPFNRQDYNNLCMQVLGKITKR